MTGTLELDQPAVANETGQLVLPGRRDEEVLGGYHHHRFCVEPSNPLPGVETQDAEGCLRPAVRVAPMVLVPQPSPVLLLDCACREEVSGPHLGRAEAGQPLPCPGSESEGAPCRPCGRWMSGEGRDQHQFRDTIGMSVGQGLGYGATHRVAHGGHRAKSDVVEHSGDVVGYVFDVVGLVHVTGQPV